VDSHTLLANKVLNMVSEAGEGWPTTMQKYGYAVRAIKMSVRVGGRNVSPDIVLASDRHGHAMVIDCKSGANVDLRQDRLYSQMAIGDLWRAGVPRAIRLHTPIYAINNEHVDRISGHTDQALMVFGRRTICGIGDFGNAELTRELRAGIRLKIGAMPDTDVCPFSIRDAHGDIDRRMAWAVERYLSDRPGEAGKSLATRPVANAILLYAHPLHGFLSSPHRSELRRAAVQSIARLEGSGPWWLGPAARRRARRPWQAAPRGGPPGGRPGQGPH